MKSVRKLVSILCLFSFSGIFEPWTPAECTTPAQQETASQAGNSTSKAAADATFRGVKVTDAKGKQTDATLTFSDNSKEMVVRVSDKDFMTIPYDQLDKVSYEYTKKHRVAQGAIVMAASLGAGAIVMMTKSKSHWLYIDFHEQNVPKNLVLRMDKNQYKSICEAVKTHTGKEVEFPKDGGERAKKEEKKKKDSGSAQ
jgi:hypothetical protein